MTEPSLKVQGFSLIDHNSNEHKQLLLKCTKAISSHVGPMIIRSLT